MDEALSLTDFVDKIGTVFLGVAFVYALWRQYVVFGWVLKECQAERDRYRKETDERVARLEAELERVHTAHKE